MKAWGGRHRDRRRGRPLRPARRLRLHLDPLGADGAAAAGARLQGQDINVLIDVAGQPAATGAARRPARAFGQAAAGTDSVPQRRERRPAASRPARSLHILLVPVALLPESLSLAFGPLEQERISRGAYLQRGASRQLTEYGQRQVSSLRNLPARSACAATRNRGAGTG